MTDRPATHDVDARPGAGLGYDAIVLSGGRGSRLGGVAKGGLVVEGQPLLTRALAATRYAARTIVVGDGPVPQGVLLTREHPEHAGPAAAVAAGLALLREQPGGSAVWTLVLACDVPGAADGIPLLTHAATSGADGRHDASGGGDGVPDGWCLTDSDGRLQWLFGLYRTSALQRAVEAIGDPANRSMGRLLGGLDLRGVPTPPRVTDDIDTPEDLARWTP